MTRPAQPRSDLGLLLLVAYQGFVDDLHAHMAERGFDDLGRSDGLVFRLLGEGPRSASELARLLGITKQGAAQIVDDMEARGYVVRRPDVDDRRARAVELSDRGRRALSTARRFHRSREDRLVRRHGSGEVAALRAVLGDLAAGATESLSRELRALYL